MNEIYFTSNVWAYWDGKQAGMCTRGDKRYVFWLHDWSADGLYPIDDDGKDLPRIFDLYLIENDETFNLLDGWNWDDIDAWVATREPVSQCTENQLKDK
jgi:hypothetical protein